MKLKFYELMIQLDQHESEYLKICKHFRAIYDTNSIQEDSEKKKEVHLCSYEKIILPCVHGNVNQLQKKLQWNTWLQEKLELDLVYFCFRHWSACCCTSYWLHLITSSRIWYTEWRKINTSKTFLSISTFFLTFSMENYFVTAFCSFIILNWISKIIFYTRVATVCEMDRCLLWNHTFKGLPRHCENKEFECSVFFSKRKAREIYLKLLETNFLAPK